MVPLESQACGRPVIAYGKGGSLETVRARNPASPQQAVVAGEATGTFFYEQTVEAVMEAILASEAAEDEYSPQAIQTHARQFDTALFVDRLRELISPWLRGPIVKSKADNDSAK
jgi:glycosyltransferase involved in cell wall biosynthesis